MTTFFYFTSSFHITVKIKHIFITGYRYAMMSAKTILTKLIMKYKFFTSYKNVEEIKVYCHIMLRPEQGYKITIHARN